MKETKIQWCDHTFNPWWGCVKVSPECDHCYAETFAKRTGNAVWGKDAPRRFFTDKHWAEPLKWNTDAEKAGERRRVFCGSMCDVMEDREDLQPSRVRLYNLIQDTPWLDWLLLTKRPQNFRRYLPATWIEHPRHNVWLMTTVGMPSSLWRIDALKGCPAVVRGLSIEPLLEPLPTLGEHLDGIDWAIFGGESGGGARPCSVDAIRHGVGQCRQHGVAPFVKQLGARPVVCQDQFGTLYRPYGISDRKGGDPAEWPEDLRVREYPEVTRG